MQEENEGADAFEQLQEYLCNKKVQEEDDLRRQIDTLTAKIKINPHGSGSWGSKWLIGRIPRKHNIECCQAKGWARRLRVNLYQSCECRWHSTGGRDPTVLCYAFFTAL